METKVEELEDNKIKITVTVDAKDVNERIKKQYKDIANKYNFPGFRKGKAPRPIIDNMFGGKEAIRATVTEDAINDLYPMAVDDCGHMVIGQPTFSEENDVMKDNEDYTFDFTMNTKPAIELDSYEPLEIKMPPEGATDKEIDEQVETLTKYYVKFEDARANTKAKKDSRVELTIEATDEEGQAIASLSSEQRTYIMGSGLFPKEFDDEVIGMKKGDEKEFALDVDADNPGALLSTVAGKKVNFKVELIAVKKEVKPELTDEWVKENLGFETVQELRDRISEQIVKTKETQLPELKEERCLEVLRDRLTEDAPEAIVEETESSLLQDFFTQLQRQGMTFDNYLQQQGLTSEGFRDDLKKQAADVAKEELAVEAWARHFEIEANHEDLVGEFEAAGMKKPEKTMKEWHENGRLHLVSEAVMRRKAMEAIMEGAKVTVEE